MEAASYLAEMFDRPRPVYLRTEPEIPDFTTHAHCQVVVAGGQRRVEIDLDRNNATTVLGLLAVTAFDKEKVPTLLCWNLKSLLSYFRFYINKPAEITAPILDLQVIENFLGIKKESPKTIADAVARSKEIAGNKNWKQVYNRIHLPLIKEVLPSLETFPLLDVEDRTPRYAHYEIEGQRNARLRCSRQFEKSLLAHNLGAEQKAALRPRGYNLKFLVADFRHCEINVIQWLSGDERLGEIIHGQEDLYRSIYRVIAEDECNSDKKRAMAKIMLLAVFYGSGSRGLSESLHISEAAGRELIRRIHYRFPQACRWFDEKQQEASGGGNIYDYFGRPRAFPDNSHAARNFVVQGVAATVCLEKLIQLHQRLAKTPARLCLSIHDGYGIVTPSDWCQEVASIVHEVLESPSELCPGLRMKAEVKAGDQLDKLMAI